MQDRLPTKRRPARNAFAAVLLAGTALGGYALGHAGRADEAPATTSAVQAPSGAIQPVATQTLLPDFSGLVTQVRPAVVSITTKLREMPADDEGGAPSFPGMPHFGGGDGRAHGVEARGSGFIIDANGTVVTNNHVVKDALSVSVTLDDGTQLPAKVIGRDPRSDLAVLRVDAGRKLAFIQLGDSDMIKPGQWVVAMGNPFGLGGSVSAGIVSARGRDIGSGPYDSFIQVDAPINQGNSGGPLFTQDGKVIGVNTAIISPSGGSVGIGFAIPSDTVRSVVAELERTGHVTRGYLGVSAQPLGGPMTAALHLPSTAGALVAGVEPDSPAAKAGLEPGDVIESVNGAKVANPRDLALDVSAVKPGETASLHLLRDGGGKDVTVTVATLPGEAAHAGAADQQQPGIGLALAPLSPDMRAQLNLPGRTRGAVVAEVRPGSPAEQAGLQQGDVVVGVGSKAVASPEEAVSAIRAATSSGKAAALRIVRDGAAAFVAVAPAAGAATPDEG